MNSDDLPTKSNTTCSVSKWTLHRIFPKPRHLLFPSSASLSANFAVSAGNLRHSGRSKVKQNWRRQFFKARRMLIEIERLRRLMRSKITEISWSCKIIQISKYCSAGEWKLWNLWRFEKLENSSNWEMEILRTVRKTLEDELKSIEGENFFKTRKILIKENIKIEGGIVKLNLIEKLKDQWGLNLIINWRKLETCRWPLIIRRKCRESFETNRPLSRIIASNLEKGEKWWRSPFEKSGRETFKRGGQLEIAAGLIDDVLSRHSAFKLSTRK